MIIIHFRFSKKTRCNFCSFLFFIFIIRIIYICLRFSDYTWHDCGMVSHLHHYLFALYALRSSRNTSSLLCSLTTFDSVCFLKLFCFVFSCGICWCCLTFKSFHFWGYVFVIICVTYRFTLALISIMNIALSSLVLFSFVSCILFSNAFAFVTRDYIVVI